MLAEHRGYRNIANLPDLTVPQILTWVDGFRARTGEWPTYVLRPGGRHIERNLAARCTHRPLVGECEVCGDTLPWLNSLRSTAPYKTSCSSSGSASRSTPGTYTLSLDTAEPNPEDPNIGTFFDRIGGLGPLTVSRHSGGVFPFYGTAQLPLEGVLLVSFQAGGIRRPP